MKDYVRLRRRTLSRYTEIVFVDIKTDNGLLFDSVAKDKGIRYKSKGLFARNDTKEYVIRNLVFRKNDLGVVEEAIAETYNKALILGYNQVERWKDNLYVLLNRENKVKLINKHKKFAVVPKRS